jgi:hypothetical protein
MLCKPAPRRVVVACAATLSVALATAGSATAAIIPEGLPGGTLPPVTLTPVCLPADPACLPATEVVDPGLSLPAGGSTDTPGGSMDATGGGGDRDTTGPADTRRPTVLLTARRGRVAGSLRRGLTVQVSCDEACSIQGRLLSRSTDVAGGVARLRQAGKTTLRLRFTKRARKALARRRTVKLVVHVTVTDAAGNTTTARKRVVLRR